MRRPLPSPLPRRRLLALGIGTAGAALSWPALRRTAAALQQPDASAADAFFEPAVRASRDGRLATLLEARLGPVEVAGRTVQSTVYEGTFPGPTLRIRPGDRLQVTLVNALDAPTNLHTHGFHVSPSGSSDNVLLQIDPGGRFVYDYAIPADHPPGFYWYHPHFHGVSAEQVFGGMAGAVIIEGALDRLPGVAGLRERLLVLQATKHEADGAVTPPSNHRFQQQFQRLVNGRLDQEIPTRPGETQRWRILNASTNVFFRLRLDGHLLHHIAEDGNTLGERWSREEILLGPAERCEVLVQAGAPGSYSLRSLPFDGGFGVQPETVLATMTVAGAAQAPQPLPTRLLPFLDLRSVPIDHRRTVTLQSLPLDRNAPEIPMATFMINSRQFAADRVDQTMRLNTTEEWVVRNASDNWHPFHIHVNPFQVVAVNGRAVAPRSYQDTVPVPPLGEVVLRTQFLDFTGRFVFHCHILQHEDGGMMSVVEVAR